MDLKGFVKIQKMEKYNYNKNHSKKTCLGGHHKWTNSAKPKNINTFWNGFIEPLQKSSKFIIRKKYVYLYMYIYKNIKKLYNKYKHLNLRWRNTSFSRSHSRQARLFSDHDFRCIISRLSQGEMFNKISYDALLGFNNL